MLDKNNILEDLIVILQSNKSNQEKSVFIIDIFRSFVIEIENEFTAQHYDCLVKIVGFMLSQLVPPCILSEFIAHLTDMMEMSYDMRIGVR